MKDVCLYSIIIFACIVLIFACLSTDFARNEKVYQMWINNITTTNITYFTFHITGPTSEMRAEVFFNNQFLNSFNISVPSTTQLSVPGGKSFVSVKVYDSKKNYDEFGSKAKPYEVFFRVIE